VGKKGSLTLTWEKKGYEGLLIVRKGVDCQRKNRGGKRGVPLNPGVSFSGGREKKPDEQHGGARPWLAGG